MAQKLTPGERAIYNGKSFVKDVTKSIKNNSYSVHKYSDNTDINFLHEQYGKVAIEGYPFMNMYGRKSNHSILIIDDHGKKYRVYTDVTCSQCGAPILAIIDDEEPGTLGYIPSIGCSNRFCKDYIR